MKSEKFLKFLRATDGSVKTKALRAGFWLGLAGIVIYFLSLIRSIVLARLLSPEMFGMMAICLIVIRGMETFTKSGLNEALITRQSSFDEAKYTAFSLLAIRGFLLATIVFGLAPFIADFYSNPDLTLMLQFVSISFIFIGFINIDTVYKQKELDFRQLALLQKYQGVFSTIFIITLAYFMRSVWALLIGYLFASILHLVLSYVLIKGKFSFAFNKKIAIELLSYGKFVTASTIVLYLATEMDNAVIGKVLSADMLGFYVIAFTLANLVTTEISKYLSRIMLPVYSKLQNDKEALKNAYLKVIALMSMLVIPTGIGMMVLANEIVLVLYGEKWAQSVTPLYILAFFGLVRSFASASGYLFHGIGKPKIDLYVALARLLAIVVTVYFLTVKYELLGAAISVVFGMLIQWILGVVALRKLIGLKIADYVKAIYKAIIFGVLMGVIVYFCSQIIDGTNILGLASLILIGAAFYGAFNYKEILRLKKSLS